MEANMPTPRTTDAFGVVVDVEISEAFELHRVLEEKRRQNGPPALASDGHNTLSEANIKSPENGSAFGTTLVHVRAKDRLLRSYGQRKPWNSECPNAKLRPGLWVVNPEFGSSHRQMGFLSQLAQLCVHSELHSCTNPSCAKVLDAMSKLAPECDWAGFREWALVAMSCQASMNDAQKRSRAHTHVARAVSGCFVILKTCSDPGNHERLLLPFLDGQDDAGTRIGLTGVVNIIHWMVEIQSRIGTAAEGYGNWNHLFLPSKYALMEVQVAQRRVLESGVCQNRLWNLVNVSDRKQSELPDIIKAIEPRELFRQQEHGLCTPSKCHVAHQNNTEVPQMHRCFQDPAKCDLMRFPKEGLISRVNLGKGTSWWLNRKPLQLRPLLDTKNRPYLAISHVWSDGTGAGVRKEKGIVNSCLFGFFANIAKDVGCDAIWWDTISIPDEAEARKKSLTNMHHNYAQAKCTVVHDKYLFHFPWSDDGKPCLALVLSNWFARGWTALELAMSPKVKVLFRNPSPEKGERDYVLKDLDDDILARSPRSSSRAHWLATTLVQRIRRPINHVGDLIAILAPRSTSWTSDRTKIATLLADVPKVDFTVDDSIITRRLLNHLGKIPYFCLLHGKPTMAEFGGFSWSAVTLDDMPVEVLGSDHTRNEEAMEEDHVLTIDGSGAVWGKWMCRAVDESDILSRNIKPYGDSLPATVKVELELGRWSRCLLLRPSEGNSDPRALLVAPTDILDDEPTVQCRYIGTVTEENHKVQRTWYKHAMQLGGDRKDLPALPSAKLLALLHEKRESPSQFKSYTRLIRQLHSDTADESSSIGQMSTATIPDWIRDKLTQQLSTWFSQGGVRRPWVDPGDLEAKSLIVAAEARNHKAARFLVKHRVRLSKGEQSLVGRRLTPENAARALILLANVHMEHGMTPQATEMYQLAIKQIYGRPYPSDERRYVLESARLALGRAFTSYQQLQKDDDRNQPPGAPSQYCRHEEAERLFRSIVDQCKARKRKSNDLPRRESYNKRGSVEYRSLQPAGKTNPLDEGQRATNWLKLELEALAELIQLAIARYDFEAAAREYKNAMSLLSAPAIPVDIEGFKVPWASRKTEKFQQKQERDEQAARSYYFVARKLETLFKRDNALHLITKLQTGICYALSSSLIDAEDDLREAVNGLISLSEQRASGAGENAAYAPRGDRAALIALAQYHYGAVLLQKHKFVEAEKALEHAEFLILPATNPRYGLKNFRHAISIAFSDLHLENPDSSPNEAMRYLSAVLEEQRQRIRDEATSRLVIAAKINLAKAIFRARGAKHIRIARRECLDVLRMIEESPGYVRDSDIDEAIAQEFLGTLTLRREAVSPEDQYHAYQAALESKECSLKILKAVEGTKSILYLKTASSLAKVHIKLDRFDEAQELYKDILTKYQDAVGKYAPPTLYTHLYLGRLYFTREKYNEAEEHCFKAQDEFPNVVGWFSQRSVKASLSLGDIYFKRFKLSPAIAVYTKTLQICRKKRNPSSWFQMKLAEAKEKLAKTYAALGGPENDSAAIDLYQERLADFKGAERNSQAAHRIKLSLGNLWRRAKQFEEASTLIVEAHNKFMALDRGSADVGMYEAKLRFGELILDMQQANLDGKFAADQGDPKPYLREAQQGLERTLGERDLLTIEATVALGEVCNDEEGETHLQKALAAYKSVLPAGAPEAIRVMDLLINHWRQRDILPARIEAMKKEKWEALKDGYGEETAIAIMKITDPRKDNLYFPDPSTLVDKYADDEALDSDDMGIMSDDESGCYSDDSDSSDSCFSDYEEVAQELSTPEGRRRRAAGARGGAGAFRDAGGSGGGYSSRSAGGHGNPVSSGAVGDGWGSRSSGRYGGSDGVGTPGHINPVQPGGTRDLGKPHARTQGPSDHTNDPDDSGSDGGSGGPRGRGKTNEGDARPGLNSSGGTDGQDVPDDSNSNPDKPDDNSDHPGDDSGDPGHSDDGHGPGRTSPSVHSRSNSPDLQQCSDPSAPGTAAKAKPDHGFLRRALSLSPEEGKSAFFMTGTPQDEMTGRWSVSRPQPPDTSSDDAPAARGSPFQAPETPPDDIPGDMSASLGQSRSFGTPQPAEPQMTTHGDSDRGGQHDGDSLNSPHGSATTFGDVSDDVKSASGEPGKDGPDDNTSRHDHHDTKEPSRPQSPNDRGISDRGQHTDQGQRGIATRGVDAKPDSPDLPNVPFGMSNFDGMFSRWAGLDSDHGAHRGQQDPEHGQRGNVAWPADASPGSPDEPGRSSDAAGFGDDSYKDRAMSDGKQPAGKDGSDNEEAWRHSSTFQPPPLFEARGLEKYAPQDGHRGLAPQQSSRGPGESYGSPDFWGPGAFATSQGPDSHAQPGSDAGHGAFGGEYSDDNETESHDPGSDGSFDGMGHLHLGGDEPANYHEGHAQESGDEGDHANQGGNHDQYNYRGLFDPNAHDGSFIHDGSALSGAPSEAEEEQGFSASGGNDWENHGAENNDQFATRGLHDPGDDNDLEQHEEQPYFGEPDGGNDGHAHNDWASPQGHEYQFQGHQYQDPSHESTSGSSSPESEEENMAYGYQNQHVGYEEPPQEPANWAGAQGPGYGHWGAPPEPASDSGDEGEGPEEGDGDEFQYSQPLGWGGTAHDYPGQPGSDPPSDDDENNAWGVGEGHDAAEESGDDQFVPGGVAYNHQYGPADEFDDDQTGPPDDSDDEQYGRGW